MSKYKKYKKIYSNNPADFEFMIGKKVAKQQPKKEKFTKKKFKSGLYVNTILSITIHSILQIPAFTFEEDDSIVECRRCKIVTLEEINEFSLRN